MLLSRPTGCDARMGGKLVWQVMGRKVFYSHLGYIDIFTSNSVLSLGVDTDMFF